jgi:hypothetical protein
MSIKDIFLNKTLFVVSIILFTITVIFILINSCSTITPKANDIVLYPFDRPTLEFPIDLYLTKSVESDQVKIITKAIAAWNKQTKNGCEVNLISNWEPPTEFNVSFYETYKYKTVWFLPITNDEVAKLFLTNRFFDGVAIGNFILISSDGKAADDDDFFYVAFKHEFGHMMGLQHLKPEYSGIMDLGGNNGNITRYDLIQFCYLYPCKDVL